MKNGICEIDSYERIAQEYHAYSKMLNPPFPDDGFWDMVRIAESGCWIWIGGPTTGYGSGMEEQEEDVSPSIRLHVDQRVHPLFGPCPPHV